MWTVLLPHLFQDWKARTLGDTPLDILRDMGESLLQVQKVVVLPPGPWQGCSSPICGSTINRTLLYTLLARLRSVILLFLEHTLVYLLEKGNHHPNSAKTCFRVQSQDVLINKCTVWWAGRGSITHRCLLCVSKEKLTNCSLMHADGMELFSIDSSWSEEQSWPWRFLVGCSHILISP